MMRLALLLIVCALAVVQPHVLAAVGSETGPPDDAALPLIDTIPIVSDHRYRASGAIRPFVLFWISRDNVGGARITRRRSPDGTFGVEMLTGSDPERAPFRTNRWGYIREVVRGAAAELVAVKSQTEEESIEEAKANVANGDASRMLIFIRERITPREAMAWSTVADVGREISFRDLDVALGRMSSLDGWQERRSTRPSDVRPGFLTAFVELMETTIQTWTAAGQPRAGRRANTLVYFHRAKLYDLRQDNIEMLDSYDAGAYGRVRALRGKFRLRSHETGRTSGEFTAIYGMTGELAAVPLRLTYQPRWWLRTELVLDDTTSFAALRQ